MNKEEVIETVRKLLKDSTEHCSYKRAHIPDGWAHVEIEKFIIDLRNVLEQN